MYIEKFNCGIYPTKSGKTAIVNYYMDKITLYDEIFENKNKIIGESKKIKSLPLYPHNPEFNCDEAIAKFLKEN